VSERSARFSIPPAALEDYLDRYSAAPDDLEAHELLVLARAFERMGCDEQALDCADRAARLDPESKPEAMEVAKKCVGRPSRPT
jgi:tetratricopeptide (TPR) repeat protein